MQKTFLLISVLVLAVCAFAEGTRTWEQSKFEEFEKGTARGVAIRSNGALELAPAFSAVTTTPSTYIWSIAADDGGAVYAAAGSPARVYRIAPDGTTSIIFQPKELQVQALVVDSKGVIYAATSPDGKVYRIEHHKPSPRKPAPAASAAEEQLEGRAQATVDPNWVSSVIFDTKTKYIWDLALDRQGRLYIATGDQGQIFRVNNKGEGSVFFKSDEAHIRVLAFDPQGNLIAGSDGSGLVYRISPEGNAFVLYSAPKKEITALAIDQAGNIYAAGVGEKRPATPQPGAVVGINPALMASPAVVPTAPGTLPMASSPIPVQQLPANFPLPGLGAVGSEVYQIAPDGSPRRIWSSQNDLVYALAFSPNGALLAGTGNKGRIFSIRGEDQFTDLLKASATQVTHFAKAPEGRGLYVCTSNLGKLFLLGAHPGTEGTYQSDVFDAHIFSRWGRAEVRAQGNFELWARSGNVDNPDRNWSPWRKVELAKDAPLDVPPARFIQWKAVLRPNPAPVIDSVLLNYLPKNVAPVLKEVTVQVGARFQPLPKSPQKGGANSVVTKPAAGPQPEIPVPVVRDRDSIAVHWTAQDDNDDQLVYSLYYRGDGETRWKLLKDDITDNFYDFDAGLLPDGGYTVKVVASDAPSHSPDQALSDERESQRFEVDTTPPRIDDLNAAVEGDQLRITFHAADTFSMIKRAEYSVDAGDWQFVEPVGGLSDARVENYDFSARVPNSVSLAAAASNGKSTGRGNGDPPAARVSGEHLVVVRVWDRFDNAATAKTVIHAK
ncbi:MAG: hypothetical protein ACE14M_04015 [Terriglobales bacterium]